MKTKIKLSVHLTKEELEKLERIAAKEGKSITQISNAILSSFLK